MFGINGQQHISMSSLFGANSTYDTCGDLDLHQLDSQLDHHDLSSFGSFPFLDDIKYSAGMSFEWSGDFQRSLRHQPQFPFYDHSHDFDGAEIDADFDGSGSSHSEEYIDDAPSSLKRKVDLIVTDCEDDPESGCSAKTSDRHRHRQRQARARLAEAQFESLRRQVADLLSGRHLAEIGTFSALLSAPEVEDALARKAAVRAFLHYRTRNVVQPGKWRDILDEGFVLDQPDPSPYRQPAAARAGLGGNVGVSSSPRRLVGIPAMVLETQSFTLLVDLINRRVAAQARQSSHDGDPHASSSSSSYASSSLSVAASLLSFRMSASAPVRLTCSAREMVTEGSRLMCHWSMETEGLVLAAGLPHEIRCDGLLKCTFGERHRLTSMELTYDVLALARQLTRHGLIDPDAAWSLAQPHPPRRARQALPALRVVVPAMLRPLIGPSGVLPPPKPVVAVSGGLASVSSGGSHGGGGADVIVHRTMSSGSGGGGQSGGVGSVGHGPRRCLSVLTSGLSVVTSGLSVVTSGQSSRASSSALPLAPGLGGLPSSDPDRRTDRRTGVGTFLAPLPTASLASTNRAPASSHARPPLGLPPASLSPGLPPAAFPGAFMSMEALQELMSQNGGLIPLPLLQSMVSSLGGAQPFPEHFVE